jgi:hypothetical protein
MFCSNSNHTYATGSLHHTKKSTDIFFKECILLCLFLFILLYSNEFTGLDGTATRFSLWSHHQAVYINIYSQTIELHCVSVSVSVVALVYAAWWWLHKPKHVAIPSRPINSFYRVNVSFWHCCVETEKNKEVYWYISFIHEFSYESTEHNLAKGLYLSHTISSLS